MLIKMLISLIVFNKKITKLNQNCILTLSVCFCAEMYPSCS